MMPISERDRDEIRALIRQQTEKPERDGGRKFFTRRQRDAHGIRDVHVNEDGTEIIETLPTPPVRIRRYGRAARGR
jgi:hypothetical protein